MAKTIEITKQDGTKTYVSFIQNGTIHCRQAFDTQLRAISDSKATEMYNIISCAMHKSGNFANTVVIRDFDEVKAQGLREHPVCKVITGTSTATSLNLHDWEHVHFQGNLAIAVVWDTRAITKVMSIDDFTDEDFSNMQFVYNDNCNPVCGDAMQNEAWQQTFNQPTIMTDAQFNLIKGRK